MTGLPHIDPDEDDFDSDLDSDSDLELTDSDVDSDLDEDEEYDEAKFECRLCGGSGGHPDLGCPGCGTSGIDRRAMREARDEARADRDY